MQVYKSTKVVPLTTVYCPVVVSVITDYYKMYHIMVYEEGRFKPSDRIDPDSLKDAQVRVIQSCGGDVFKSLEGAFKAYAGLLAPIERESDRCKETEAFCEEHDIKLMPGTRTGGKKVIGFREVTLCE